MKQFGPNSIGEMTPKHFWFEAAMIGSCAPVFHTCVDNHEVELMLRKEGVIKPSNKTDSESSALVVNFKSRKSAEAFVDRLNKFLKLKFESI